MGATVTTKKLAAAFRTKTGQIGYVLFEELYEKNVHPHRPEWSCQYLGSLEGVMWYIFLCASSCEGGMLQGRNGRITPEGYIAGWLEELANPVELANEAFELKAGEGFYSTVPTESLDKVCEFLSKAGRDDIVTALRNGEGFEASLYDDFDAVSAIYGGNTGLGVWRIIRKTPVHGVRNADLGYKPVPAKGYEVHVPAALKLDRENRLIQREDGTWYCGGWEYYIVQRYICSLWESELREPGSYRKRIKAYRNAVETANAAPAGMKVAVDVSVPLEDRYGNERVAKMPKEMPVTLTPTGYEIDVTEDRLSELTYLPAACTSWIIPAQARMASQASLL